MAVSHETVYFDVHDCKVYALLTDTVGASPTYGPAKDVPGIAEIGLEPNFITAELKGDARVMAKKGRIDRVNFSATYGKIALDPLLVMYGGTVTDVAELEARYDFTTAGLPYFKIEAKIEDVELGLGDLHLVVWKAQITGGTILGSSTDNFGQPSLSAEGIKPEFTGTIGGSPVGPARLRLLAELTSLSA